MMPVSVRRWEVELPLACMHCPSYLYECSQALPLLCLLYAGRLCRLRHVLLLRDAPAYVCWYGSSATRAAEHARLILLRLVPRDQETLSSLDTDRGREATAQPQWHCLLPTQHVASVLYYSNLSLSFLFCLCASVSQIITRCCRSCAPSMLTRRLWKRCLSGSIARCHHPLRVCSRDAWSTLLVPACLICLSCHFRACALPRDIFRNHAIVPRRDAPAAARRL